MEYLVIVTITTVLVHNVLTQGFSNFFVGDPYNCFIKIWRPSFDVKYLIKWLYLRTYDQKNQNFDIWRPFLEVWRPPKGSRPLV
jgi:hypothetical protein